MSDPKIQKILDLGCTDIKDGALLVSYLRAEQAREAKLEDVARKYGLVTQAWFHDGQCWTIARRHNTPEALHDLAFISNTQGRYPTRRACDDAILQAVDAYEKEGGK